jgi:hypothetical protein
MGEGMRVFGKRIDVPGGNRRANRERVVLAAAAVTLQGSQPVVVEDVGSTGAKLRGRGLPATGQEMIIKIGNMDVLASVAWSKRDECGITFDAPLDPASVTQLKAEGQLGRVMGIV